MYIRVWNTNKDGALIVLLCREPIEITIGALKNVKKIRPHIPSPRLLIYDVHFIFD